MIDSERGAARAEDAPGTPTQSHISPGILVYEDRMNGPICNAPQAREVTNVRTHNLNIYGYYYFYYYHYTHELIICSLITTTTTAF